MRENTKWIYIDNERFYYNEIRLEHGRKRIDRDIAKENLELFYNVISETDINYGLFFGTLLGAIREGNFIEHDEDTDLYVLDEDKKKILKLLPTLNDLGLKLVRYEDFLLSLMRKNEYIDLYFFKSIKHIGGKAMRKNYYSWEFDAEPLENPERFIFLGMDFPVPENPENMLEVIYGKNWRTPIENYNAPKNTILGRLSYLAPMFRKLPFYNSIERILIKIGK